MNHSGIVTDITNRAVWQRSTTRICRFRSLWTYSQLENVCSVTKTLLDRQDSQPHILNFNRLGLRDSWLDLGREEKRQEGKERGEGSEVKRGSMVHFPATKPTGHQKLQPLAACRIKKLVV